MRFALVGAGFIGRIHGLAIQAVNRVFGDDPLGAEATVLIDSNPTLAEQQARQLGFARWTTDWRNGIEDAEAVVIAAPSFMHREIALGAIARGKHVLCEKPVGRVVRRGRGRRRRRSAGRCRQRRRLHLSAHAARPPGDRHRRLRRARSPRQFSRLARRGLSRRSGCAFLVAARRFARRPCRRPRRSRLAHHFDRQGTLRSDRFAERPCRRRCIRRAGRLPTTIRRVRSRTRTGRRCSSASRAGRPARSRRAGSPMDARWTSASS